MSDLGCEDLAEGLKVNESLRHLVVSQNDVADAGVAALAGMLARNTTLQTLDLSYNPGIGDEGVMDLCEVCMCKHVALTYQNWHQPRGWRELLKGP